MNSQAVFGWLRSPDPNVAVSGEHIRLRSCARGKRRHADCRCRHSLVHVVLILSLSICIRCIWFSIAPERPQRTHESGERGGQYPRNSQHRMSLDLLRRVALKDVAPPMALRLN